MKIQERPSVVWKYGKYILFGIGVILIALIPCFCEQSRPFFVALGSLSSLILLIVLFRQTSIMKRQSDMIEKQAKIAEKQYGIMRIQSEIQEFQAEISEKQYGLQESLNSAYIPNLKITPIDSHLFVTNRDLCLWIKLGIQNLSLRKNKILNVSAKSTFSFPKTLKPGHVETYHMTRIYSTERFVIDPDEITEKDFICPIIHDIQTFLYFNEENVTKTAEEIIVTVRDIHEKFYEVTIKRVDIKPDLRVYYKT
jgi:hypothetical protein